MKQLVIAMCGAGLLAQVACGSVEKVPDANTGNDAAVDAAPDAVPQGVVTVEVYKAGMPVSGVPVLFQNADGSVRETVMTADGIATATVTGTALVTVIAERSAATSWVGVKPGDRLSLGADLFTVGDIPTTIQLPVLEADRSYRVSSPCIGVHPTSATNIVMTKYRTGCNNQPIFVDKFVTSAPSQSIGSYYLPTATFAATIDLTNATFKPSLTRNVAINNVPGTVSALKAEILLFPTAATHFDGSYFEMQPADGGEFAPNPILTNNVGTARAADISPVVQRAVFNYDASGISQGMVQSQDPGDVTFDLGAHILPSLVGDPTYDGPQNSVAWTQTASGRPADGMLIERRSRRDGVLLRWTIYAPATTGTFMYPTMPAEYGQFNWSAADTELAASLVLMRAQRGYDAIRELRGGIFGILFEPGVNGFAARF